MSRTLRISALGLLGAGLMGSVALAAANPPKGGGGYGYGYGGYSVGCKTGKPHRPGFGFGDKNHCHTGAPGLIGKGEEKGKGEQKGKGDEKGEVKPLDVVLPAVQKADDGAEHGKGSAKPQGAPVVASTTTTTSHHDAAPNVDAPSTTGPTSTVAPKHGSEQGQVHGSGHQHNGPHGH